jgi:hypothetical protein
MKALPYGRAFVFSARDDAVLFYEELLKVGGRVRGELLPSEQL